MDSRVWADNFARFGPQVIGRTMFDFGYPNWGENPPFHAPVFVVTHRGQERIEKGGGTSYTFVTSGIAAAVEQARAVADGKDVLLAGGGQHRSAGVGGGAGGRGRAARGAEAGGPGSSAVRWWRGGSAVRRDHRGRGSSPSALRGAVIADGWWWPRDRSAAAWRVTSAVTPAPPEEAETGRRIIGCRYTPDGSCRIWSRRPPCAAEPGVLGPLEFSDPAALESSEPWALGPRGLGPRIRVRALGALPRRAARARHWVLTVPEDERGQKPAQNGG